MHLFALILVLIIGISITAIYLYRPIKKRNYLVKFNAPDFQTAEKIAKAGFSDYNSFLQSESKAKLLLDEAYTDFYQGKFEEAIKKNSLILDILPFSGNHIIAAEAVFRLSVIYWEQGKLKDDNIVFKNIPSSSTDPKIAIFKFILNALRSEVLNNWGKAEKLWLQALEQKNLLIDYELTCLKALSEIAFRAWFFEQTDQMNSLLFSRLNEWQEKCQKYEELGSLSHLYILRARYSLASYQFDEVEEWLHKCNELDEKINLPYYHTLIQKTNEELLQSKERIESLTQTDKLLLPEDKERLLQRYMQQAVIIVKKF
ncbi:MAG: hypothetical protein ACW99Q_30195 [Candidatus Kariarchaeaceae archaeon]